MANRKGVFIGAYVPNELKESLRRRAAAEHEHSHRRSHEFWSKPFMDKACRPEVSIAETPEQFREGVRPIRFLGVGPKISRLSQAAATRKNRIFLFDT